MCHNSFGSRLKQVRLDRDLSLGEVANKTGVTKSLLSKYERDTAIPGTINIVKLARYYNVSVDWLVEYI